MKQIKEFISKLVKNIMLFSKVREGINNENYL